MWPNRPAALLEADAGLLDPGPGDGFAAAGDGIAAGISVVGDIKGAQNLTISGAVTGSVFLPRNEVRVRAGAVVNANITARLIEIEGRVAGDLKAAERIIIRSSSTVEGDIVSPQIQLEEGCRFKGSVQMNEPDVKQQPPSKPRVIGEPGAVRIKVAVG